ncbi:MAG: hypothetical protein V4632_17495 [Pseudomonadota bacterium]
MNNNKEQNTNSDETSAHDMVVKQGLRNASRRRFTKSGLAASGVIMTLASKPVLGDVVCTSPSGFLSVDTSTHGPAPVCLGRSPGYWKNHVSNWPIGTDTKFSRIFTCSPNSNYKDVTMLDLLDPQKYDKHGLGRHLVAAYLNAEMKWTPFLPTENIVAMFTECQSPGYYKPTATVQWTPAEVVEYISSTQA